MILDREDWQFAVLEPLHGAVIEVHVGDLELGSTRYAGLIATYGEAVVL
jgi:hypothetical protein